MLLIVLLLSFKFSPAQDSISISTSRTSCLIFPAAVNHVDMGSPDVLVSKVKDADNLLLVKAVRINFQETNLSVLTADGKFYSIIACYDSMPGKLVYHPYKSEIAFVNNQINKTDVTRYSNSLLNYENKSLVAIRSRWGVQASLNSIYVKDNILFLKISISNKSPVRFDIDDVRYYVKDKKRSKRTALHEVEMLPVYKTKFSEMIYTHEKISMVVAMDKFTLPSKKYIEIEIKERNGERHLSLKFNNKNIMMAKRFSD